MTINYDEYHELTLDMLHAAYNAIERSCDHDNAVIHSIDGVCECPDCGFTMFFSREAINNIIEAVSDD